MLLRTLLILLVFCAGCRSGIIPCPDPEVARLKKSTPHKRARVRDVPEPVVTVSSNAETPRKKATRYRYVKYEIQHVDVEELDCPRPGEKKTMPKAVRENIRKNRRKVRYYYQESPSDSLTFSTSATAPRH